MNLRVPLIEGYHSNELNSTTNVYLILHFREFRLRSITSERPKICSCELIRAFSDVRFRRSADFRHGDVTKVLFILGSIRIFRVSLLERSPRDHMT